MKKLLFVVGCLFLSGCSAENKIHFETALPRFKIQCFELKQPNQPVFEEQVVGAIGLAAYQNRSVLTYKVTRESAVEQISLEDKVCTVSAIVE